MKTTDVRQCNCGHFYVGDHGCPCCKAPWLATRLAVRASTRKLARIVAEGLRARPDQLAWYKERYHVDA